MTACFPGAAGFHHPARITTEPQGPRKHAQVFLTSLTPLQVQTQKVRQMQPFRDKSALTLIMACLEYHGRQKFREASIAWFMTPIENFVQLLPDDISIIHVVSEFVSSQKPKYLSKDHGDSSLKLQIYNPSIP